MKTSAPTVPRSRAAPDGIPPSSRTAREANLELLFTRWQRHRDEAARDALLERYLPLARNLARRYIRSSEPFEDLMQVASLGLVKALDRFDPARGHRFAAFAVPTILGELRRYFRDAAWAVHVPRGAQERALEVEEAQQALGGRTGRSPTVQEVAEYLELDTEHVLSSMQVAQAYTALSLDAPRSSAADDLQESYGDSIGAEDERYELIEADIVVTAAVKHLPARERKILHLRFVQDMTQSEIAAEVGLSQMQISRLLRRSLDQLRQMAGAEPVRRLRSARRR